MAVAAVRQLAADIGMGLWIVAGGLVAPIWRRLHHPDRVLVAQKGVKGSLKLAGQLRQLNIEKAFVLPGSTRAALLPWLARIPRRVGYDEDLKRYLLTEVPEWPNDGDWHKSLDYFALIHGIDAVGDRLERMPVERLRLPSELAKPFASKGQPDRQSPVADAPMAVVKERIAIIPGAARGPAKRWPTEHFSELARRLLEADERLTISVLGAAADKPLGAAICGQNADFGERIADRTGQTTIDQWLDAIATSGLVVCNDSGGMHVADGYGRPLIALFGTTDPAKTGPSSPASVAMQKSHFASEKISRDSKESQRALAAITPDEVYRQSLKMLEWRSD